MPTDKANSAYLTWIVSEKRRQIKRDAVAYKGGCCSRCGYAKCVSALQFHHKDPEQKDFAISGRVMSWVAIQAELDKTILVCANCHLELHHEQSEAKRAAQEEIARKQVPKKVDRSVEYHGTNTGYNLRKCRCLECKKWAQEKHLRYRSKKG